MKTNKKGLALNIKSYNDKSVDWERARENSIIMYRDGDEALMIDHRDKKFDEYFTTTQFATVEGLVSIYQDSVEGVDPRSNIEAVLKAPREIQGEEKICELQLQALTVDNMELQNKEFPFDSVIPNNCNYYIFVYDAAKGFSIYTLLLSVWGLYENSPVYMSDGKLKMMTQGFDGESVDASKPRMFLENFSAIELLEKCETWKTIGFQEEDWAEFNTFISRDGKHCPMITAGISEVYYQDGVVEDMFAETNKDLEYTLVEDVVLEDGVMGGLASADSSSNEVVEDFAQRDASKKGVEMGESGFENKSVDWGRIRQNSIIIYQNRGDAIFIDPRDSGFDQLYDQPVSNRSAVRDGLINMFMTRADMDVTEGVAVVMNKKRVIDGEEVVCELQPQSMFADNIFMQIKDLPVGMVQSDSCTYNIFVFDAEVGFQAYAFSISPWSLCDDGPVIMSGGELKTGANVPNKGDVDHTKYRNYLESFGPGGLINKCNIWSDQGFDRDDWTAFDGFVAHESVSFPAIAASITKVYHHDGVVLQDMYAQVNKGLRLKSLVKNTAATEVDRKEGSFISGLFDLATSSGGSAVDLVKSSATGGAAKVVSSFNYLKGASMFWGTLSGRQTGHIDDKPMFKSSCESEDDFVVIEGIIPPNAKEGAVLDFGDIDMPEIAPLGEELGGSDFSKN